MLRDAPEPRILEDFGFPGAPSCFSLEDFNVIGGRNAIILEDFGFPGALDRFSAEDFSVPDGRDAIILEDFGTPGAVRIPCPNKKLSRSSHSYFFARIENSINLGLGPRCRNEKPEVENTILWGNLGCMAKKVAPARAPATFFNSISSRGVFWRPHAT